MFADAIRYRAFTSRGGSGRVERPLMHRYGNGLRALVLLLLPIGAASCFYGHGPTPDSVTVVEDVSYCGEAGCSSGRHRLDLYVPKEATEPVPVVLFVPGGGWTTGDRSMYRFVGNALASKGVQTAVMNYRLSPAVQHPAHVEDVARAFAWLRENARAHGGRPDRIFLMGHSVGAHLTSLLALDAKYLRPHGLSPDDIRGVIAMSGIYEMPGPDYSLPLAYVFGVDPAVQRDAMPINHVLPGAPPFRLVTATSDLPGLADQAADFNRALTEAGVFSELLEIGPRGHFSLITDIDRADDAACRAVISFVRNQSRWTIARSPGALPPDAPPIKALPAG